MIKNSKEARKDREHGPRKKIRWSIYLLMEERNVNDKRNGEWQRRKEQPKMAKTKANGEKWS